ncbi:uncharacterized protein JCM6883_006684 [Sporobolomyces salmoneus]|uniref:uncharacterized protein n=1 Tax=Sporobolomyces salmoneus TaxID=183962 RepID=UPI00316DA2D3
MNPLPPSPTRSTSHSTQPDDSLSFSDSSLPSSSFSPPTITSLPPEFISEIFRAIPGRPGSESTRDRTLASLCLVNRLFLQLARPILYREVYVDFTEDFEEEKFFRSVKFFRSFKILRTLIDVPRCGTLVKRLRFDLGRVEIPFIRAKVLARLLTALKSLEGIEVINGVRNQGIDGVIVRCRPRLKSLEVPEMELDGNNLFRIFNTLDELEVYVGPLPAVHQELDVWATAFPPSSHLRRVAVNFPVDPDSFRRYIEPSRHVLTKLAISLDVEHHEFDLSGFSNLTELHIRLGNVPKTNFSLDYVALERSSARIRRFITSKHREDVANFASSIQRLLRSTQSTPIKYLTISTSRDTIGGVNINQIIRIGKKLFTFWKKWDKKRKQQAAQQAHQQQGQQHYPQQNQYQGGYNNQQQQSPYPAPAVGQGGGGAWHQPQPHSAQSPVQSHYYGAGEGKPTKLTRFPSPSPSPLLLHPQLPRTHFSTYSLSPFSNAYRIPQRPLVSSFSTASSPLLRNRSNWSLFDPSSSFPPPSHRQFQRKPPPPRRELKLSIFHLLPAFLRPSYKTLLRINDDIFVHLDETIAEEQNYDMTNAQNAHYVELRNKAIYEGDLMAKCFADSQRAYQSGSGESAHQLSLEGKQHQRLKDEYNDQAAEWIFRENNRVQPNGSIDLHGLYVQESIEFTEKAIDNARNQGLQELRVIVGKGNHSPSHVAKLKPAITSLMNRKHLTASLDPHNNGVLIVQLQGQGMRGGERGVMREGDELVRSIGEKEDGGCLIM